MKRTLSALLAATVATGALITPLMASAEPYRASDGRVYDDGQRNPCQQRKHNGSTGGAILGALAGAALGSNIGGHGARTEGAVIGGVGGAVVGSNVGRAAASNSDACQDQANYDGRTDNRRGFYDQQHQYRDYGQVYYYNDGFYDRDGAWHYYGRRHDRHWYERHYGQGYGYDQYNYDRRW